MNPTTTFANSVTSLVLLSPASATTGNCKSRELILHTSRNIWDVNSQVNSLALISLRKLRPWLIKKLSS